MIMNLDNLIRNSERDNDDVNKFFNKLDLEGKEDLKSINDSLSKEDLF